MKNKKTILLGGLVLVLVLGVYVIAWAALDVGNDLDMQPIGHDKHKIFNLADPLDDDYAATWGYVKDAVNGEMPGISTWRQNASQDVYLNDALVPVGLSGNVGIGTNDPSESLHIYDATNSAGIKLQSNSASDNIWSIYSSTSNHNLAFYSHYSTFDSFRNPNIITFAHGGKIGIGTTAPRQHLSIGTYLDIYDGAVDDDLEYPSIRSSIENLTINGPNIYGGVYLNYDSGKGVKFFAHPDDETTLQIAELNDNGDLHLNGTLNVDSGFQGTSKNYVYGKLGVGKILNPVATLDVIADIEESEIFKVSYLESTDFSISYLPPNADVTPYEGFSSTEGTHYEAVDDPVGLFDTNTYIEGAVGQRESKTDLFNIPSLTGDVYSIDYVEVIAVCKSDQTTNPAFASPVIKIDGTIYANETFTELDENYQTITFIATQNPNNGSPLDWTESNITNLQIGVQARGGPVPPDGPPQIPTSFIAGTKILMADGGYENIEKIKAGDKVISYDLIKKQFVDNQVISILDGENNYLLINDKLGITLNQKVYVADKGFIQAKDVKIGDYLLNESKKNIKVNSIKNFSKKVDVYDLVLKSPHNFFADGYLAHNIGVYQQAIAESGVVCTQIYAEVGYFKSEPTSALIVDNAGNVGIGTINPYSKLNVFGGDIYLSDVNDGIKRLGAVDVSGVGNKNISLELLTTGSGHLITAANVGIGVDPGGYKLKVASDSGANPVNIGDDLTVGGLTTTNTLNVDSDATISGALSVSKTIKISGTGSEICDSASVGKMRYHTYDEGDTYYYAEFQICMQTDTSSYSWHTIHQERWGGASS